MRKIIDILKNNKVIIIIIIAIAAITYFSLRGCSRDAGLIYRYEKATIGEVKKTISTTGSLEIINQHLVLSRISGLVTNVYVDYNDNVKKNQLLATLDTSEIDQEIIKIDSRRKATALDFAQALRDLNYNKDMLKDNLVAKKGVEQAELQYKKLETQLEQIKNEYEIARRNKENTKILAPSSGVIISKDIQPNVPITENKVLFIIAEDMTKMQLIIQVDESDIGLINNDQKVTFTVSAYPEKIFEGKITQVRNNPIKKEQLVSYPALVTCDNKDLMLKAGMTATATVEVSVRKNVLRVPSEAFYVSPIDVENDMGKKYLWKKQAMSVNSLPVKRIEVKTGLVGDFFTEVISNNINEGDEILYQINKSGAEVQDSIRK